MQPDLWALYKQMLRGRLFEEVISQLWEDGLVSGEMHLGTGEEAIVAGVLAHLREGDALALDHRSTPPLVMRGVDLALVLRELLGLPDGLNAGMGGHMHLFSPEHLAATSGIVGASGPAAVGFALAGRYLRPGTLAVAFFGEGAANQGMLLESLNLAVVWGLPVLFVCKDDNWAITTQTSSVTGANLAGRARGFGMEAVEVDGRDVESVWQSASEAAGRARAGEGPTFIHALCIHLEGHFLGYELLRAVRRPAREMTPMMGPLVKAFTSPKGASVGARVSGLRGLLGALGRKAAEDRAKNQDDPVWLTRGVLDERDGARLLVLEEEVLSEIQNALETAVPPSGKE